MAPTSQLPSQETFRLLEDVLKRRATADRVRKTKNVASAEDYRVMRAEQNRTQYLPPVDLDNTKASIYYTREKFISYCKHIEESDWLQAIKPRNCDKGMMMGFLHWICEKAQKTKRRPGKRKALSQY